MALTCPQCAGEMKEVAVPASVGYSILLDQCPRCGGIWCDRWELYPLTPAAADRIDPVDQSVLWQPTGPRNKSLECPRCRARLRRFSDPSLPQDARIERCPNCDGMWLNRGELRRFKHRDATGDAAANAIPDSQLDRLARETSPPSSAVPVQHLADAFDAPESAPDSSEVGKEIISGAAWLVARTVLRLLLHV
jgi:Zn-finger nucleic acid-binding protein